MVAFPEHSLFPDTPPSTTAAPFLRMVPPVVTPEQVEHEVEDCFDDENITPGDLGEDAPSLIDPDTIHGGAYALFPYQAQAVAELENGFFVDGLRSQRLVVPTAGGKTVIFSTFIKRRVMAGDSVLVLVHRNKLLRQAEEKLNKFGIFPLIEQGTNHALSQFGGKTRVVIASVQSLHKERAKRWARDSFDWIVSDETHHCRKDPNNHWFKLVRYFNTARHLGVTATPGVMKGKKYIDVGPFQRTVEPLTLGVGIQQGYLSRLIIKRCRTDIDLSNIGSVAGDYKQNELDAVIYKNTNKLATAIKDNIGARPTYVFTPQVASAEGLAKALNDLGVLARAISYHNTQEEDEQIHKDHAAGVFQVLCNAMKLTEGVDAPFVECVVLARPTQSVNVYRQCVGRGLRLSKDTGKENCLILDFGFVTARLKLAGAPQQVNDLFTEDEDAEALQDVMQEFMDEESEAGRGVDILEALDVARERLQEREEAKVRERERLARIAAQREAARVRHREHRFDYSAVEYDPMVTELLNIPERTALNWTNTALCEPATDKQKNYITKCTKGKIKVDDLTKQSAAMVIGEIEDARKKGLSSIPQRHVLVHKLGQWCVTPEVAKAMTYEETKKYISDHKQW